MIILLDTVSKQLKTEPEAGPLKMQLNPASKFIFHTETTTEVNSWRSEENVRNQPRRHLISI